MQGAFGGNGYGNLTQTAGTKIRYLVPPFPGAVSRITKVVYTAAGTAHTLTFLRPIGRTTAAATGAAGQANVSFAAEPGAGANILAANDNVAIRETDGITRNYLVSSVPGAYPGTVVLTTNLVAGVVSGSKIWNLGVETDTDPATGLAHPALAGTASVTSTYQDSDGGVVGGTAQDDPILFSSNNATAAGTLNHLTHSNTVR